MDMSKIVTQIETAAEDLTSGVAGPMPQFEAKTPTGKAGYNHMIDAMNRLPRPLMALGSLGVFVVAGINPPWFETQMQALAAMPQPLWWLLGAVMTMFFGSREAHYIRTNPAAPAAPKA
ncbi:MAG: 3TM-type holin [Cypionkella sp.]